MTRIITLTGGSDGRGDSRMAADLAVSLTANGQRVCLLALVGGANTVEAGSPRWSTVTTLADSLPGDDEASRLQLAPGCDLVVGGRQSRWLRTLNSAQLAVLGERLQGLGEYDYLLIDAGTGSDQNQLAFALASPQLLLVITPASESLSAAYGLLKVLYAEQYAGSIAIVVTQCDSEEAGRYTYDKLRGIAGFYLEMPLPLAGIIAPGNAADLEKLTVEILAGQADTPALDMADFVRRYLRAAGVLPAPDSESSLTPVFAASADDHDLQDQLTLLSGQVDDLIAEVERLRGDASTHPSSSRRSPPRPPAAVKHLDTACIASMASGSDSVTVGGETFTVYHLRRSNGRQLRFACQSTDDDLEEPEPQSRLS